MNTNPFLISRRRFLKNTGVIGASVFLPFQAFSFTKSQLSFGVITDSHYADRDAQGTRFYRDSLGKMRECISFMNKKKPKFLIHLGDFKDQIANPTEESTLEFVKTFEKEYAKFNGPIYHVIGNHDVDSISKKQFLNHINNSGISKKKSFYSFENEYLKFIVLDANFRQDGHAYSKGDFDWKDTYIPVDQIVWLKNTLASSDKACVVFVHQLLDDSESPDHSVKNAAEVRRVLQDSQKVACVFQGHVHQEVYHKIEDIHYYAFNAMVDFEGEENNSFSIVTVDHDLNVQIDGYYRSSDRHF